MGQPAKGRDFTERKEYVQNPYKMKEAAIFI
jgi:hypothetical protein